MGDVSGKGVAAALMMAKFSGDTPLLRAHRKRPPAANELNTLLYAAGIEEKFITLSLTVLDLKTRVLTVASAGHPPVLVRRANGRVDKVGEEITGYPLGIVAESNYEQIDVALEPGDVVVMYSDGVTDGRNFARKSTTTRTIPASSSAWPNLRAVPKPSAARSFRRSANTPPATRRSTTSPSSASDPPPSESKGRP